MIVQISIPISNIYANDTFYKDLYFECDSTSPTKLEVISYFQDIIKKQYSSKSVEETEILSILNAIEDSKWAILSLDGLVLASAKINHPMGFGMKSVIWSIIQPIKINR